MRGSAGSLGGIPLGHPNGTCFQGSLPLAMNMAVMPSSGPLLLLRSPLTGRRQWYGRPTIRAQRHVLVSDRAADSSE